MRAGMPNWTRIIVGLAIIGFLQIFSFDDLR
jgi:hypothetical protein